MKKIIPFLVLFISSSIVFAQSIPKTLTKLPYQHFYLYEGDQLKFEINGDNKKLDIHFGSGYSWSEVLKTRDITTYVLPIKKNGVYTIGWMGGAFKKAPEVSLIRIPAPGKENSSTEAPKDTETIVISNNFVFRGDVKLAQFTTQTIDYKVLYKVVNSSGEYVAVMVGIYPTSSVGPMYTKLQIYKAYDIISKATPLKIIENTSFDKINRTELIAFNWLASNGYIK